MEDFPKNALIKSQLIVLNIYFEKNTLITTLCQNFGLVIFKLQQKMHENMNFYTLENLLSYDRIKFNTSILFNSALNPSSTDIRAASGLARFINQRNLF